MSHEKIAEVFDDWARSGRGAGMEDGHGDVVAQVVAHALDRVAEVAAMAFDVGDLPGVRFEDDDAPRKGGSSFPRECRDGEGDVVVVAEEEDVASFEGADLLHEAHPPQ